MYQIFVIIDPASNRPFFLDRTRVLGTDPHWLRFDVHEPMKTQVLRSIERLGLTPHLMLLESCRDTDLCDALVEKWLRLFAKRRIPLANRAYAELADAPVFDLYAYGDKLVKGDEVRRYRDQLTQTMDALLFEKNKEIDALKRRLSWYETVTDTPKIALSKREQKEIRLMAKKGLTADQIALVMDYNYSQTVALEAWLIEMDIQPQQ